MSANHVIFENTSLRHGCLLLRWVCCLCGSFPSQHDLELQPPMFVKLRKLKGFLTNGAKLIFDKHRRSSGFLANQAPPPVQTSMYTVTSHTSNPHNFKLRASHPRTKPSVLSPHMNHPAIFGFSHFWLKELARDSGREEVAAKPWRSARRRLQKQTKGP